MFARNPRSGALRQLTGARGCISQFSGGGCVNGRGLNEPIMVIVSRDGKRVYVASRSPGAVAVFRRGPGGALTQRTGQAGCISQGGREGCTVGRGLKAVWDVAASADGKSIYAAGNDSNSLAILQRTRAGLSQPEGPAGCLARSADEGCTVARALGVASGVAVSPDGRSVYVASYGSDAVAILRRNRVTGALTQTPGKPGCVSQAGGGGCAAGRVLDGAHDVAVSPDGRNAYVVSEEINAMSVFARNRSTGDLSQLPGKWACLIRGGVLGCPDGKGLSISVSVTVSRDGRNVYVGSADDELGGMAIFRRLP